MDDADLSSSVNSIIDQLKETPRNISNFKEQSNVTPENLEEFILKHASGLVVNATEAVENMKDYVGASPTSDEVSSLADLINATSSALESMSKILIANKKNATTVKVKQMDIDNKQQTLDTVVGASLTLTREELMKQLLKNSNVIEAEYVDESTT